MRRKKRIILLIISICVGVIAAVVGGILLLYNDEGPVRIVAWVLIGIGVLSLSIIFEYIVDSIR